jgi:hypothetical protein
MPRIEEMPDRIVTVNISENPKQRDKQCRERFDKYDRNAPRTVSETLSRGVRPVDIRYDWNWGYISVTEPPKKPLDIAEALKRCGLGSAEYLFIYNHPDTGPQVLTNVKTPRRKFLVNEMFRKLRAKGSLD